jgi:hypothetical protein
VTSGEGCVLLTLDETAPRGMAVKYREKEGTDDERVGDGQQHFGLGTTEGSVCTETRQPS